MPIRIKVFLTHIALSCFIISLVGLGFVSYFYPSVFANLEGVYKPFITLAIADIVIGPLLVLIIYKPGKKGLLLDLYFIALCQATALSYGLYVLYDQRPGFLVFYHDSFYSFPASIDQEGLVYPELRVSAFSQPKVIAAELHGSTDEKFADVYKSLNKDLPVQGQAKLFVPLKNYFATHQSFIDKKNLSMQKQYNLKDEKHYYFEALAGGSSKIIKVNKQSLQLVELFNEQSSPTK